MSLKYRLLCYAFIHAAFPTYGVLHDGDWTSAKGWWIFTGILFTGVEVAYQIIDRKKK